MSNSNLPDDFDILESFDYVDRDFDTLYARLQSLVVSVWPNWNLLRASWDNYLLGLMSHVGDIVNYYRDNRLRESYPLTAVLRESLIRLGGLVGYELYGPTAATATEKFTLDDGVAAGDVLIPAGTQVLTKRIGGAQPLKWQTESDLTILAGATEGTVSVRNTETKNETRTSSGAKNQEYTMSGLSYIDGTLDVSAANGAYTEVDNFLGSTSTDRHYTVIVNTLNQAIVQFGDGLQGEIPVGTISMIYEIGGGSTGEVESGTITRSTDEWLISRSFHSGMFSSAANRLPRSTLA